jgi:hypothetical protein
VEDRGYSLQPGTLPNPDRRREGTPHRTSRAFFSTSLSYIGLATSDGLRLHSRVAGADCIEDMDMLRHGAMRRLFVDVRAREQ